MSFTHVPIFAANPVAQAAMESDCPSYWRGLSLAFAPATHGLRDASAQRRRINIASGAPARINDTQFGQAMRFDGSSDRLLVNEWGSLDGLQSLALTVVFRTNNAAATQHIAGRFASPRHFLLYLDGGKVRFRAENVTTQVYEAVSTSSITTGKAYVVTGLYDNSTQSLRIAVNGVVEAETIYGFAAMETSGASGVAIGGRSSDGATLHNGSIALCTLHERVPSELEVAQWAADPFAFLRRRPRAMFVFPLVAPVDFAASFTAESSGTIEVLIDVPSVALAAGWSLVGPAVSLDALSVAPVIASLPDTATSATVPVEARPAEGQQRWYLLRRTDAAGRIASPARVIPLAVEAAVARSPVIEPAWPRQPAWRVEQRGGQIVLNLALPVSFARAGVDAVIVQQRVGEDVAAIHTAHPARQAVSFRVVLSPPEVVVRYRWVLQGDGRASHITPWSAPVQPIEAVPHTLTVLS